jgi:hypothetical protein
MEAFPSGKPKAFNLFFFFAGTSLSPPPSFRKAKPLRGTM